jgi:hypothetical protein
MKQTGSWRDRLTARAEAGPSDPASPGSRFASFRRLYRWLNLTLVHQGVWPLLILLAGAPTLRPSAAPFPWQMAATGAPAVASLLAVLYLAQRPSDPLVTGAPPRIGRPESSPGAGGAIPALLQSQARVLLFGVAAALAAARLVIGPSGPTAAYLLFGLADVLAFQLIHFGVVAGAFGLDQEDIGQAAAILLFGLSWGLRELFLAGVGVGSAELGPAFVGGLAVGLIVALISRLLRRWPGGFWAAAAGHWLLIYLFFGFIR